MRGPPTLRNVGVTIRDGSTLAADVYLPDGAGPWLTLVLSFPYSTNVRLGVSYSNYLAYFAEHGYGCVMPAPTHAAVPCGCSRRSASPPSSGSRS